MWRKCLLLLFIWNGFSYLSAQTQSLDALKKDFPLLTAEFEKELEAQRADYIFAVDVSGTMNRYKEIVIPALQEFFRSLEVDDYVSVIKFGGAAKNDLGSYGKIDEKVIKHLLEYAPKLYERPIDANERQLYFSYTDLDAMLHYLANDMKQINRNKLKFVFIITDFDHDPSPGKRGKEDWAGVTQRIRNEQSENDIYVFALQLPGTQAGKDYPKVRNAFPPTIDFEYQEIRTGEALSAWFQRKKGEILLDKFAALIKSKVTDPELNISPTLSIDGKLDLNLQWSPDKLVPALSIDSVRLPDDNFIFISQLPVKINDPSSNIEAGKIQYYSLYKCPLFHSLKGDLTVYSSPDVPWQNELTRLNIEWENKEAKVAVDRDIFSFCMSLWLTGTLLGAFILYVILVIMAFKRNSSKRYKVSGSFTIRYNEEEIEKVKLDNLLKASIGKSGTNINISHPSCDWLIEIYEKKYSPFLRFYKKPQYRIRLLRGSEFRIGSGKKKYDRKSSPVIIRPTTIKIGDFAIGWKLH